MSARLQALADFAARLDAVAGPAHMRVVARAQAVGHVLADEIRAPHALPETHVALEAGCAVASRDTVGASAQSPVMLAARPVTVAVGDPLPPGCDAVCDPAALETDGPVLQVTEQVAPGQGVRFAGHDCAAGGVIARRGMVMTPTHALAAALAGIETIATCALPVHVADAGPVSAWLAASLDAAGGVTVSPPATAALRIEWRADLPMGVALAPGGALALRGDGALLLSPRFDAAAAALFALLLPLVATRTFRRMNSKPRPLLRKIASPVGLSDIVLLAEGDGGVMPLAAGGITLEALLRADCFALLPAGSEGGAVGTAVAVTPIHHPLVPAS